MPPSTRTVRGVAVRRWATYPNQWGPGVVHLRARGPANGVDAAFKYVRNGRMWRLVCLRPRTHGDEVEGDDLRPVTCKRCLASGWVPKAWQPIEDHPAATGTGEDHQNDDQGAEMALQAGSGAGNYIASEEWVALGKEGALVACVVLRHGTTHMEKGPSAGQDIPKVEFDLYILDGSRKGEVHIGQDVIQKGLVTPLRRVEAGEEVAYRMGVGNNFGRDYPQLNAPGDLPDEAVKLFEQLKAGEQPAQPQNGSAKASGKASSKTKDEPAKEPATVGGGGSDEGYDDEPDF